MDLLADRFPWLKNYTEIEVAIMIAIIVAVGITLLLVATLHEQSFSSVYLNTTSNPVYSGDGKISFVYGIQSSERQSMTYKIEYLINNVPSGNKEIQLQPGDKFEEKKILDSTNLTLPAQVRVEVTTPTNSYEVHYWIQKPE